MATGKLPSFYLRIFSRATGWTRFVPGAGWTVKSSLEQMTVPLLPESVSVTHDCTSRELPHLFPDYPLTHTFFRPVRVRKVLLIMPSICTKQDLSCGPSEYLSLEEKRTGYNGLPCPSMYCRGSCFPVTPESSRLFDGVLYSLLRPFETM